MARQSAGMSSGSAGGSASSRNARKLAAMRRPASAQASAASRAGAVPKIAMRCCAGVRARVPTPNGTRKNVTAARKSTPAFTNRLASSPSTGPRVGGAARRANFAVPR